MLETFNSCCDSVHDSGLIHTFNFLFLNEDKLCLKKFQSFGIFQAKITGVAIAGGPMIRCYHTT